MARDGERTGPGRPGSQRRPEVLDHVVRFLRQREELGGGTILLDRFGTDDARRILAEARSRPSAPATADGPPADATGVEPAGSGARPSLPIADLPADHEVLREAALDCTRCRLCADRTQVVFHDGSPDARLMVVGEAPGANEDRTGVPFVGAAGRFLDLLMASVGLSREESVYICNVLKCRPPGNRNPRSDEIETCSPWLLRQIEVVRPEVILAVGTFSAQLLTGRDMALGRMRGEVYSYHEIPLVVTYHPAALLRNSRWTRPTWEDFQLLREVMEGKAA